VDAAGGPGRADDPVIIGQIVQRHEWLREQWMAVAGHDHIGSLRERLVGQALRATLTQQANHHVHIAGAQVSQHILGVAIQHAHIGIRIRAHEFLDHRGDHFAAGEQHRADDDLAPDVAARGFHFIDAVLDLPKRKFDFPRTFGRCRRCHDPRRGLCIQSCAQCTLEIPGSTLERCLRHPQSARGLGE